VTTHADPQAATPSSRAAQALPRLISVGRLDINTEGLLLLTMTAAWRASWNLPATGWLRRLPRARARARDARATRPLEERRHHRGMRYGAIEATLDREQGANVWLTFAIREARTRGAQGPGVARAQGERLIRVSFGPFELVSGGRRGGRSRDGELRENSRPPRGTSGGGF